MMIHSVSVTADRSAFGQLRAMMVTWCVAAFLPLPVLVAINPAASADVSCLYLGLANAWLVTEFQRVWGIVETPSEWRTRMLAVLVAVLGNMALFVGFGLAAGVRTHFPFPLMAMLSVVPVLGMLPWLLRRAAAHPYAAIVLGGFLVGTCKIAGCIVARFVYGPDYIAQGYVSADWHTAKLMISVMWILSTSISLLLLVADYGAVARRGTQPRT